MDCRQIDRLLEANLEGRLSGFERMGLRQHLKTCRACRAKVEAMTAFSKSVEKTLAGAEGPAWDRLAPPRPLPARTPEPRPAPPPRPAAAARPTPRRTARAPRPARKPWSSLGMVVAGMAVVAVVLPFWTPRSPVVTAAWLDAVIAAEATRRAAGGRLDLVTADLARASDWLDDRGLPALPALALPADAVLEGVFLTHYDGARVAGLVLATAAGPLAVHLRPAGAGTRVPTTGTAADGGYEAVGTELGTWRAAVVGRPEAIAGADLAAWLPVAPGDAGVP